MDISDALKTATSAMRAQGLRLRTISENIANADTAPTSPGADPYRRKVVTFRETFDRATGAPEVNVQRVVPDTKPFDTRYEPSNPGADASGYVKLPNINPLMELMDMREAQRSYSANISVVESARAMLSRTIDLLKS
ncbi:MAG TPA: flagellar basal body rod protein FlgC [Stellaceae bacterium]|nr:flagellar basal body rod protein FlgC [Stellaceae bacterium]